MKKSSKETISKFEDCQFNTCWGCLFSSMCCGGTEAECNK